MAKPENVTCPLCDGPMTPRMSAHGKFWGCQDYPRCRGTRNVMGDANTPRQGDAVRHGGDEDASMPSDRWRDRDRRRW
jgi:ssDNA-binding Zn-finger/Zn-ribbon topoisomerase 1